MSGVDIAGLVARLLSDIAKMADGERQFWAEKLTPLLAALEAKDRALLAQAAELAEAREESARRLKCMDRRADRIIELGEECKSLWGQGMRHVAVAVEATRQRDEALAALKASEERGERLREALDGIYTYCNDTLSGRADGGPDDRAWQRTAVIHARNLARSFARPEIEAAIRERIALADATNNPPSDLSSLRKGADAPCPHAPTYDAGLCCGHPDDCTFVSPPASREESP